MIFTGITPDVVALITRRISRERYGDNPVVEWERHRNIQPKMLNDKGTRFRGRIVVNDSRGPGARTSASGRHGPYACWHVFRDVLEVVIMQHGANVTTGMARYTPETWHDRYPGTGTRNIGSAMRPARMIDLCECGGAIRYGAPALLTDKQRLPDVDEPRLVVVENKIYDLQTSVEYLNNLMGV